MIRCACRSEIRQQAFMKAKIYYLETPKDEIRKEELF